MDELHGINVVRFQINTKCAKTIFPCCQLNTILRIKPVGVIQNF